MDGTLHDMRNDLAVAIGTVHALLDRKLEPTPERLALVLAALERIDAALRGPVQHELRTPLGAIVGAAELLGRSQLDERTRLGVTTIAEAAEALLALIGTVEAPRAPSTGTLSATGPILVAEDNEPLRRLLALQFDDLGVAATFVADGREALAAVRARDYALVFMDCQMPHLDGLAATKAIRDEERASGRHVPIAAMTAGASAEDRAVCLAAGMDDYLSKPVKIADLRAVIERWGSR